METLGGGGLQLPEETKLQRQQKGKLTKQEVGGGFAYPPSHGAALKTHAEHIRPHGLCIPLELGSWFFPVFGPERLSGVSWKYSELLLMKLHGVHNPRWPLHLTAVNQICRLMLTQC